MPTANELIQEATISHMVYLEALKTKQARVIVQYIDDEILPDLKAQLVTGLNKYYKGSQNPKKLEAMIASFEAITDRFKKIDLQKDLVDIAEYEAEFNLKTFQDNIPIALNYTLPAPELLTAAIIDEPFDGRTLRQWFDSLGSSVQARLASEIRRGIVEGQVTSEIVDRIEQSKIIDVTRRQAEAVTRTAIQHATNAARTQFYEANADIVKGYKWVSTLDSRTSAICQERDGKVYPLDSGIKPPAHVNCRSTTVAITKSWRELGLDVDELPPETRASMNGQVPAELTYNDWLKKQSNRIQDEALGKTRAKLFREGVSVDRFVNRNGFEYTLDELRKKEGIAFKKAGL